MPMMGKALKYTEEYYFCPGGSIHDEFADHNLLCCCGENIFRGLHAQN